MKTISFTTYRTIRFLLILGSLFALWFLFISVFKPPTYLVPSPSLVIIDLWTDRAYYIAHLGKTAISAMVGFLLATLIAWSTGIAFYRFTMIRAGVLPIVTALQAVPIVALAPLYVVWLGSGFWSKALMATTIAYFPTLTAMLAAFAEVDEQAKNLFRLYDASYIKTLCLLLIPASLPTITAGMQVSGGLATVGAIVAEMTGSDSGLGYVILNSSYRLQTVKLFAGIILSGILGVAAYSVPGFCKWLLPAAWAEARMNGSQK